MGYSRRVTGQEDGQEFTRQQTHGLVGDERPYATGTVFWDVRGAAGVVHHRADVERGVVVGRDRTDVPGDWALVLPDGGQPPAGPATASDLAMVTVRLGDREVPLPPLDDLASGAMRELPEVPDADLALRLELRDTPVGTVRVEIGYVAGRRTHAELVEEFGAGVPGVPSGAAEAGLQLPYRTYLELRSGRTGLLEAVEVGAAQGEWTHLLLLHGLFQLPAHRAALAALEDLPGPVGWMGEVVPWADPTGGR